MTISSETSKSGPYFGNGSTTVFDYQFKIVDASHLTVIKRDADGVETVLVLDADYTVSDVGEPGGGQITMVAAPANGETITILRNVPFTQETDLENQGAYYAETVEAAFDLMVMRDQQLQEQVDRAPKFAEGGAVSGVTVKRGDAGKVLGWDENGNIIPLVNSAAEAEIVAGEVRGLRQEVSEDKQATEQARTDAENFASTAAGSVIAASTQANRAEGQADRAELARDAAFVSADVYPDIPTGLAAVQNGEQFQVVEGDTIIRYRRDPGPVAIKVAWYPSADIISAPSSPARPNKAPRSGNDGTFGLDWIAPTLWQDILPRVSRVPAALEEASIVWSFNPEVYARRGDHGLGMLSSPMAFQFAGGSGGVIADYRRIYRRPDGRRMAYSDGRLRGLLVEPATINKASYPFDLTKWVNAGASATKEASTAFPPVLDGDAISLPINPNFASGWTFEGSTAPTSMTLRERDTSGLHWAFSTFTTVAGRQYTAVFDIKKGAGASAPDIMQLAWRSGGMPTSSYANFNITTGEVVAVGANTTALIEPIDDGWRCTISCVATSNSATAGAVLAFVNNNPAASRGPTYLGSLDADVEVIGPIKAYEGNTSLVTSRSRLSDGSGAGVFGRRLTDVFGATDKQACQAVVSDVSARYVFLSSATDDAMHANNSAHYDLRTGKVIAKGSNIDSAAIERDADGRWILSFTRGVGDSDNRGFGLYFSAPDGSGDVMYTGNGDREVIVHFMQAEAGSFITSLVPGAGAAGIRSADQASIDLTHEMFGGMVEGTFIVVTDGHAVDDAASSAGPINAGINAGNRLGFSRDLVAGGTWYLRGGTANASTLTDAASDYRKNDENIFVVSWKSGETVIGAINGVTMTAVATDITGYTKADLWWFAGGYATNRPRGIIKEIIYIPRQVSEEEASRFSARDGQVTSASYFKSIGTAVSGQYAYAARAANGKIYCAPFDQGAVDNGVLVIDPSDDSTTYIGAGSITSGVGATNQYWLGALTAPNGKIYMLPIEADRFLVIDPSDDSISYVPLGLLPSEYGWYNGVIAGDVIYVMPRTQTDKILRLDTSDDSLTFLARPSGLGEIGGATVGLDGKIYGTPRGSSAWLVIDPSDDSISTIDIDPSDLTGANPRWTGGVAAGQFIYTRPRNSPDILVLDTNSQKTRRIPTGESGSSKWDNAVKSPRGNVWFLPRSSTKFMRLTLPLETVTLWDAPANGFIGHVVVGGIAYTVPFGAARVGKWDLNVMDQM